MQQDIKQVIIPILKLYGVSKAAIFGSYSRGDQTDTSDIDIVIDPPQGMSYFTFFDLKEALEKQIQKKVDLLTYRGLNPHIKPYIERDQIIIYEKK
jgi:predicted nucleotidyltransferase